MDFFTCDVEQRLGKENRLIKLNELLDWKRIGKLIKGLYKAEAHDKGGQRPYDSLKMFKAILLGQWYSLSDPALEESLRVRLDFMHFTGFELGCNLPDDTTLCRFRNRLIAKGLDSVVFEELNRQLEQLQIKVSKCEGAIVDATIISSANRPNRTLEVDDKTGSIEVKESADPDARWLKKGKQSYFGYRGYIRTDSQEGYIESVHVRSANKAETHELARAIDTARSSRIYADKGFASKANRDILKERKLKDGLMEKAARNRSLSYWQKLKNRLISKRRFIVERTFGTLKRKFMLSRSSYCGERKVEAQLILKSICLNLLKAANAVEIRL